MRMKAPAAAPIRYGYRRLHILLRREGWDMNDPALNSSPGHRMEAGQSP